MLQGRHAAYEVLVGKRAGEVHAVGVLTALGDGLRLGLVTRLHEIAEGAVAVRELAHEVEGKGLLAERLGEPFVAQRADGLLGPLESELASSMAWLTFM